MKSTHFRPVFLALPLLAFLWCGCEKEITVDLPAVEAKVVIDGSIELGRPPIILLSKSQGYFDPVDLTSLEDLYIKGAVCSLTDGTTTATLDELCVADLPEELLDDVAALLGFSAEVLVQLDLCAYTLVSASDLWGQEGKTYSLTVDYQDHHLTAQTKLNAPVALDATWFELSGNSDSLGFLHAQITDPDTIGNAYRWYAQRLNNYEPWAEQAGQQKDGSMIAPLGSVADDEFFNGLTFEFAYFRGTVAASSKEDDYNEERGYFKVGDTVAVRGCSIDYAAFLHVYAFESQIANQGSPFAIPANIPTNVEGGLGAFIGYSVYNDTIICQP